MPNTMNTLVQELVRVVESCRVSRTVRACLLSTRDRDYALMVTKEAAVATSRPLHHFSVAGRRRYVPERLQWDLTNSNAIDAYGLLQQAEQMTDGGIVVLEDCLPFLKDENGDQRWRTLLAHMLSSETHRDGLVLAFLESPLSERHLPAMLAEQFVRLVVPYPRSEELEAISREEIAVLVHNLSLNLSVEDIQHHAETLIQGLAGLTRTAARDALRDAITATPNDFEAVREQLQQRKAAHLKRELAMNVLSTEDVEEPIGLDYLVDDIQISKEKMSVFGPSRAKGILLVGPPGSGKTMLARCIGKLVNLPVVEFRISSIMNSLLGETEQRFARAFATLEAMAPNVVFIDEIEKAFGDSSERDGGTMMRCTGSLLSWLSDNPFPNFIVATANNLSRMGEIGLTMTRSERFDNCFFVDVPSLKSRQSMLERWLRGTTDNPEEVARELALLTKKFSGADLRSLVKTAKRRADYEKVPLSKDMLIREALRKEKRVSALYNEFTALRNWGRVHCDPAGPFEED